MKKLIIALMALLSMNVLPAYAVDYKTLKLFGDETYFTVTGMILDYDTTLAANSDQRIPTQKALKTYVDSFGGTGAGTISANAFWTAKGQLAVGTGASAATPLSVGVHGSMLRVSTDTPVWSTATFADTYAKGTFLYAGTANAVDALAHPGAAYYLLATNSADSAGWFASSSDIITFLGSANNSTARTNLGAQTLHANLTAISGITPTANCVYAYDGDVALGCFETHLHDNSAAQFIDATTTTKKIKLDPVNVTATKTFTIQPLVTTDTTFIPGATFTNGKWCSFATATGFTCNENAPGGSGDVESVGDCTSGACYDGTSDGGTYVYLYDGSTYSKITAGTRAFTFASSASNSEDITLTLGNNDNTATVSSSTGVTSISLSAINLVTTGTISGKIPTVVNSGTSSYSVTQAQIQACTFFITTNAATTTYTLPGAEAGGCACFKMGQGNSQILRIDTDGSDYIVKSTGARTSAAGDYYGATASASNQVCVVAFDTTDWYVTSEVGTWSEE